MDTKIIDKKLTELNKIEETITALNYSKKLLRDEVSKLTSDIEEPYRNDLATLSYAVEKTVVITDEEKLLKDLQKRKLVKYLEIVPQHAEINDKLEEEVKEGKFKHKLIKIEFNKRLVITFKKEKKDGKK